MCSGAQPTGEQLNCTFGCPRRSRFGATLSNDPLTRDKVLMCAPGSARYVRQFPDGANLKNVYTVELPSMEDTSQQRDHPFAPVGHCFTVSADTLATAFSGGRVPSLHDGLSGPGGGFTSPNSPCMRYVHGYESMVGAGTTSTIPVSKTEHVPHELLGKPECKAYLNDSRPPDDTSPAIVDEAYAHRAWSEIRLGIARGNSPKAKGYLPPLNMGQLLTGSSAAVLGDNVALSLPLVCRLANTLVSRNLANAKSPTVKPGLSFNASGELPLPQSRRTVDPTFKEKLAESLRANALKVLDDQRYLKWLQNSGMAYMNRVELAGEASRIMRGVGGELNMPDVRSSQPLVGYEEMCEEANLDAYDPTSKENLNYFTDEIREVVLVDPSSVPRLVQFKNFLQSLYKITDVHFVISNDIAAESNIKVPDALFYFLFESFNNFGFSLDLFRSSSATWFGAGLLSKDLQRVHLYRHEAQHPQRVLDYLAALDKPYPDDVFSWFNGTIPKLGLPNRFLNYKYFNNLRDWNLFRLEYLSLNETLNLPFRDAWSSFFSPDPYDCQREQNIQDELNAHEGKMGPVVEYFRRQPNYPSMSIGQSVMNAKLGIYPWAFTEAARLELPLRYARDPDYVKSLAAKNHFARFGTSFALLDPDANSSADAVVGAPHYVPRNLLGGNAFLYCNIDQYKPSPLESNPDMSETQGCIRCGKRVPINEARAMHPFASDAEERRGSTDRYILVNTPSSLSRTVAYKSSYFEEAKEGLSLPWKFPISSADCKLRRCDQSLFGALVKRVGDINGDGFPDLVISAPNEPNFRDEASQDNPGSIYILYGHKDFCNDPTKWFQRFSGGELLTSEFEDKRRMHGFGTAVEMVDVDGNGYADLVVGAGSDQVSVLYARPYIKLDEPQFGAERPESARFTWAALSEGALDNPSQSAFRSASCRALGVNETANDVKGRSSDLLGPQCLAYKLCFKWNYEKPTKSGNELNTFDIRFVLRDEQDLMHASMNPNELPFLTLRKWLIKPEGNASFVDLATETSTNIWNVPVAKGKPACFQFILVLKNQWGKGALVVDKQGQNYSAVLQRSLEKSMLANFDRTVELELELYSKNEPKMSDLVGRVAAITSIDRFPVPLYPLYPYNYSLNMQFVPACAGSNLCSVDLSLESLTVENGVLQKGVNSALDYYLLTRGRQIVEDRTQILLKLRLKPFDRARADGILFRFLVRGGAKVNLSESGGSIRRCRVPLLETGSDEDSHEEEQQVLQSSRDTPATQTATQTGSGVPTQTPTRRNTEVAIDCILGEPLRDESGLPTIYRLAIQTDYFSMGPAQPSPFLSIRAYVFGLVNDTNLGNNDLTVNVSAQYEPILTGEGRVLELTDDAITLTALGVGDHYAVAYRSFAPVGALSQFSFDVVNAARDKTPPSNLTLRVPVDLACVGADPQSTPPALGACPRLLYLHSIRLAGDAVLNNSQTFANICRIVESDFLMNPLAYGWPNQTVSQEAFQSSGIELRVKEPYEMRWEDHMSQWHTPFHRHLKTPNSLASIFSRVEFAFPKLFHEGLSEDAVLSRPEIQVVCPEDVASMRARGHEYVLAARCIHIECSLPSFPVRRSRRYGINVHLHSRVWQNTFIRDSNFSLYKQIRLVATGSISIPAVSQSGYAGSQREMPDTVAPYKPSPDLQARWRGDPAPGVFRVPLLWVFVGVCGGLLLLSLLLVLLWRLGFFTRKTFESRRSRSQRTGHTSSL